MAKGWIKLHRSIMDHWVYESYEMQHYWIDLLLLANHDEKKFPVNKRVVTIRTGQLMTSLRKLASRWKVNKDTVRTILETCRKEGMITYEHRDNSTVITVVNYWVYQGLKGKSSDTDSDTVSDTDSDTMPDTAGDTDSTQTRMKKNDIKNEKESKETAAPIIGPWGVPFE